MAINIGNRVGLLARQTVNAAATGVTVLYTVPAGKTLVSFEVVARVLSAGASTPASARVNSASPGDLFALTAMTNVLNAGDKWTFSESAKNIVVAAAASVAFEIVTAATGGAQTLEVDLLGILI